MARGGAYAGGGADERSVDVELQTLPLHLTLTSEGRGGRRDMRITIPFVVALGCNDVVTLGDKTMKECSGLDVED